MDFREELEKIIKENEGKYIIDSKLYNYIEDVLKPNKKYIPLLYRYMPASYNNIRNLEKGELYLSEVGSMNDIFEGLSCEITDKVIDDLNKFSDMAYLKSFSENNNDLLMWSTYGDNYSGMCVEYDLKNMKDEYFYHLFPVVYKNERMTKANLDRSISELLSLKRAHEELSLPEDVGALKDIMALFLSKSKSWEYEKEWRLIVTFLQMKELYVRVWEEDDEHEEFYNINSQKIDFKYAKKVYLGPKMKADVKEHIKEICTLLKIEVFETKLSNNKYGIEVK